MVVGSAEVRDAPQVEGRSHVGLVEVWKDVTEDFHHLLGCLGNQRGQLWEFIALGSAKGLQGDTVDLICQGSIQAQGGDALRRSMESRDFKRPQ